MRRKLFFFPLHCFSARDTDLQQSWNTLSGLPSDSDFTWMISHTAALSPSETTHTRISFPFTSRGSEIITHWFVLCLLTGVRGELTCIGQCAHLKRISGDHVTETERIFLFTRDWCSVRTTLRNRDRCVRKMPLIHHFDGDQGVNANCWIPL